MHTLKYVNLLSTSSYQHQASVNGELKYEFLKVVTVKTHCPLTVIGETDLQASPQDNFYSYVQRKSLLNGVGLEVDLQHHKKQGDILGIVWCTFKFRKRRRYIWHLWAKYLSEKWATSCINYLLNAGNEMSRHFELFTTRNSSGKRWERFCITCTYFLISSFMCNRQVSRDTHFLQGSKSRESIIQ